MLRNVFLVSLDLAGLTLFINDFVRGNFLNATLRCAHSLLSTLGLNVLHLLVDAESSQCAQEDRTHGGTNNDSNDCSRGQTSGFFFLCNFCGDGCLIAWRVFLRWSCRIYRLLRLIICSICRICRLLR